MFPADGLAPPRGRPRDRARDHAILQATLELVAECGYDRTSVDAIAARAGVSKPTIYRRWPAGKEQIVVAAVCERRRMVVADTDAGSLRADLVQVATRLIASMREHADLAAGLTNRLRESPGLAAVFRTQVIAQERARFAAVLDRAVTRGELAGVPAAAGLLGDLVPALVHARAFITGDPLDEQFVTQLVDGVLMPALTALPPNSESLQ